MKRAAALLLYRATVEAGKWGSLKRLLDDPASWQERDRPLTPSELRYAAAALKAEAVRP